MNRDQDFRRAAQALVDLVFTDDMELFDSLPDEIQANMGPALSMLGDPVDQAAHVDALTAAARMVEEIAAPYRNALPSALVDAIDSMRSSRTKLE
jgi:hypothetical protein